MASRGRGGQAILVITCGMLYVGFGPASTRLGLQQGPWWVVPRVDSCRALVIIGWAVSNKLSTLVARPPRTPTFVITEKKATVNFNDFSGKPEKADMSSI